MQDSHNMSHKFHQDKFLTTMNKAAWYLNKTSKTKYVG